MARAPPPPAVVFHENIQRLFLDLYGPGPHSCFFRRPFFLPGPSPTLALDPPSHVRRLSSPAPLVPAHAHAHEGREGIIGRKPGFPIQGPGPPWRNPVPGRILQPHGPAGEGNGTVQGTTSIGCQP